MCNWIFSVFKFRSFDLYSHCLFTFEKRRLMKLQAFYDTNTMKIEVWICLLTLKASSLKTHGFRWSKIVNKTFSCVHICEDCNINLGVRRYLSKVLTVHQDLNSDPQHSWEKLAVVSYICNLSPGAVETRACWCTKPGPLMSSRVLRGLVSKKKKVKSDWGRHPTCASGFYMHLCVVRYTPIDIHAQRTHTYT